MSNACTSILVGMALSVASLVSEIWLAFKIDQISLSNNGIVVYGSTYSSFTVVVKNCYFHL